MRTIAVDWSGKARGSQKTIWVAEAVDGELSFLENGRARDDVQRLLIEWAELDPSLVVGFDFAFSFPAWFLEQYACSSAHDLWAIARRDGEGWLANCRSPFWGRPGKRRRDLQGRSQFRTTDLEVAPVTGIRPKSVFQIGGAGAVGTGSIRGMPMLAQLSTAGFAIWPFDPPGWPQVIEIYPRILTGKVRKSSQKDRQAYLSARFGTQALMDRAASTEDAFDAAVSALVMSAHALELSRLAASSNGARRLEGAIWFPDTTKESMRDHV
jgi:hypothetical protein